MSSDFAIKVEGLSKCYQIYDRPQDRLKQMLVRGRKQYYRDFWALKDVSFEIKKGETVGIIGRNGSGKSTLLQMICGTLNPTSGSMQTNGRIAALLELGSGFNPEFTGRENVYMNAILLGLSHDDTETRFNDIEAFAEIGKFIDQPVKTYSNGMLVRLAFAVIAHVDADILVIDEALAVGDIFFTQKCMRFLRNFMKVGTIVFVSHDTTSVQNLCNTAYWLDKGQLISHGLPKVVCEAYIEGLYSENSLNSGLPLASKPREAKVAVPTPSKIENYSHFSNKVEVFQFDLESSSFGKGGASIKEVYFLDANERPLTTIEGGEVVILSVLVNVDTPLKSPIVGFYVKDRLGQALFGDNSFLTYRHKPLDCREGIVLQANFSFAMPFLPAGAYSVTVAIANGTQDSHEQHHWIHDAIQFRSAPSNVTTGLVGIPMLNIDLQILNSTQ
jgi:lipopolysaccharide transport system ATP-binding protein